MSNENMLKWINSFTKIKVSVLSSPFSLKISHKINRVAEISQTCMWSS